MSQDVAVAVLACIVSTPVLVPVALLLSRRPPPGVSLLTRRSPPAE